MGAANSELKRGSGEWMHKEATGKSWGVEVHARERIELDPMAGRGGRSWGRKLPRGSSSGLVWSRWSAEVVWVRVEARGLYL